MSELSEKQRKFAGMVGELITWAYAQGYELTLGEAWRSDATCEVYAKQGKGIKNSLHRLRLALDVNLFKDGVYQEASSSYTPLGEFWESLGGSWGGRFNDAGHFSLEYHGVK